MIGLWDGVSSNFVRLVHHLVRKARYTMLYYSIFDVESQPFVKFFVTREIYQFFSLYYGFGRLYLFFCLNKEFPERSTQPLNPTHQTSFVCSINTQADTSAFCHNKDNEFADPVENHRKENFPIIEYGFETLNHLISSAAASSRCESCLSWITEYDGCRISAE